MEAMLIISLCAEIAMLVAIAYCVAVEKPTAAKSRQFWITIAATTFVVAIASVADSQRHPGPGANLVADFGLVLIGVALLALLLAVRGRRGLDKSAAA